MTLQVIGAGLGRTGTTSLKLAIEALGIGRCYHMLEVMGLPDAPRLWLDAARGEEPWARLFDGFAATVDWPAAAFYEKLARAYPEAKVILTVREPHAWFDSTQRTIFSAIDEIIASRQDDLSQMMARIIADAFDGRIHDRDHAIAVFEEHNARVQRVIPPERLLVYDVAQGWDPLCRFLGVPQPSMPFPKANTSEDFSKLREQHSMGRREPT